MRLQLAQIPMVSVDRAVQRQRLTRIGRGLVALAIVLVALVNFASVLGGAAWDQPLFFDQVINLQDWGWGTDGVIIGGLLLLLVAGALARGKRHAWWLSLGVLCFSLASAVIDRPQWGEMLLPLTLLVLTLVLAPLFATRSSGLHLWRGYGALILGIISIASVGFVAHLLGGMQLAIMPQHMVLLTMRGLAFVILSYGVVSVLRPVLAARQQRGEDHQRARAITLACGHSAMAHFALSADNSFFWSASKTSFIAYRVIHQVALALGDPIGPPEEHAALLQAFAGYCRQQDWPVAVYQASAEIAQQCRTQGWHTDAVGAEALIDTAQFTVAGKIGAPIRHAMARAQRGGLSAQCWQGEPVPPEIFSGMQRISAQWLATQGGSTQMGFSMGRFPADWSPALLTVVASDAAGQPQAFLTWTPLYAANGWSLDCMRRACDAAPGVMELLIATAIAWAKEHEYAHMSLGLAPLAGLSADAPLAQATTALTQTPTMMERSAVFLQRRGILLGNYGSLYHFKAKFQPLWVPRFLITRERTALPRIGLALALAHGSGWRHLVGEALQGIRQRRPPKPAAKEA